MNVQSRYLFSQPVSLSKRAEGEAPVIFGYGAVFYREGEEGTQYKIYDDYYERIMPGTFDRAIRDAHDVRSLFNHNPDIVLGRTASGTLKLSVDAVGLRFDATPPDTNLVRDQVLAPLERGDVSGSSIMFVPTDTTWREVDGVYIREIRDAELWETGPVTFPAYESTSAGVRSREQAEEARKALEEFRNSERQQVLERDRAKVQARLVELRQVRCDSNLLPARWTRRV